MMFNFPTDAEGYEFCTDIIQSMVSIFKISESEALTRLNHAWKGQSILGDDCLVYHEDEEYWAKDICYGHDSAWWLDESTAFIIPLDELKST